RDCDRRRLPSPYTTLFRSGTAYSAGRPLPLAGAASAGDLGSSDDSSTVIAAIAIALCAADSSCSSDVSTDAIKGPGAELAEDNRSEEHTSELQSTCNLVCR